jgi:transposase
MARPGKPINVTESIEELRKLLKNSALHLKPRIEMLILSKQGKAVGKNELSQALGVNHNSVQAWRKRYEQGGIDALLQDKRGGNRPSVIDVETDKAIALKLSDPLNAPRSFKELQAWVDEHYIAGIHYQTLNKHVKRKYGARIKVARRSHVQKDKEAVEAFKKNR